MDVDALAAGLLVAVVFKAHGSTVRGGESALRLLAGAELHVAGVLVVVVGDAGVVDADSSGGEGRDGEGGT